MNGATDPTWDATSWFARWEAMQNAYVPQRLYRFDLMCQLAGYPREAPLRILDLGCGPGALSARALRHYPNARILAVDADPVLLTLGRARWAEEERIQFLQADLRDAAWWEPYRGQFDLALSATALHWLSPRHLTQTYGRVASALKPGGCFFNSDHIASRDPALQARYRGLLRERQRAAFAESGAEDWDTYWNGLVEELRGQGVIAADSETALFEGNDDGLPRPLHLAALRRHGLVQIEVHWQDLGEAIIGARKRC